MVWYSHPFQNFPQFIVIHTVKGFGIVNKAEIDVFLELSYLFFFFFFYVSVLFFNVFIYFFGIFFIFLILKSLILTCIPKHEHPDVQAGFRKGRGTRDQIANIRWVMEKAREFHLFLLY